MFCSQEVGASRGPLPLAKIRTRGKLTILCRDIEKDNVLGENKSSHWDSSSAAMWYITDTCRPSFVECRTDIITQFTILKRNQYNTCRKPCKSLQLMSPKNLPLLRLDVLRQLSLDVRRWYTGKSRQRPAVRGHDDSLSHIKRSFLACAEAFVRPWIDS